MNSLDDLRRTLDAHAASVPDDAASARVAAVRGRAHVVRRRRAAGVAGGAALAVVALLVGPQVLSGSGVLPAADRELLGRTAPAELSSLGYTYAFDRGVEDADGASSLELSVSDEPRLVTWAADAPVRIQTYDGPRVSDRVDFDDWTYVPPGVAGTWTARGDGTALAVYTLTDDAPAGVTRDGITFRGDVAGDELLAAEIGEVGQDEVSVTFDVPEGETRLAPFCAGGGVRGAWVHVDLGERKGELVSGPGCDDPTFDPGGMGGWSGVQGFPGETLTASLYLTAGEDGPRLDLDDVRLGLGVYDVAVPAARVGGAAITGLLEHDGHLWQYGLATTGRPGTTRLQHVNTETSTQLVRAGSIRNDGDVVAVDFPGAQGRLSLGAGGSTQDLVPPGERVTVRTRGEVDPGVRLTIAVYERAD